MNVVRFILVISSLLLYWLAPVDYSQEFNIICFLIFLFNSYLIVSFDSKRIGYFNFNTIFLISFFLCSYAFPVFMLPAGDAGYLYERTVVGLSANTINKTTALNTLAISVYAYGYLLFKRVYKSGKGETFNVPNSFHKLVKWVFRLTLMMVLGTSLMYIGSSDEIAIESNPFLFVLFNSALAIYAIIIFKETKVKKLSLKNAVLNHITDFSLIVLFCLILLVVGDRGPLIKVGLILLASYSLFLKKLNLTKVLSICIAGAFVLLIIGFSRGGANSIREAGMNGVVETVQSTIVSNNNTNIWFMLRDLTGRYIEINAGYKYVLDNGFLYPWKIIPILLAPFPLIPSLLSQLLEGVPFKALSSVEAINSNLFTDQYGWMGTHCVIDVYMSWGIVGIFIIFTLLGLLFSYIARYYNRNLISSSIYIVLISSSLYLPRAVFYEFYRPLVWTIALIYILNYLINSNVKRI